MDIWPKIARRSWTLSSVSTGARARAGSPSERRPFLWSRTQRIRTAARFEVEVALVETAWPPFYQQIARKARHLRELGMSDKAIARALRVSDKTVAKAVTW